MKCVRWMLAPVEVPVWFFLICMFNSMMLLAGTETIRGFVSGLTGG